MKTVLIAGSTGMIGGLVLNYALTSKDVKKVIVINRKPLNIKNQKLKEIIHKDFNDYSKISKHFKGIDAAYFCIGAYTGNPRMKEITVDFNNTFANEVIKNSPNATYCLLSGGGADRTEKSKIAFAKYKGIAENYLLNSKLKNVQIFRPGYIYPVTPREEPNLSYKIYRFLYPIMKNLMPNAVITSEQLAKVIFEQGLKSNRTKTYENKEMRSL